MRAVRGRCEHDTASEGCRRRDAAAERRAIVIPAVLAPVIGAPPPSPMTEVFLAASLMLGFLVRLSGRPAALVAPDLLIGLHTDGTAWPWTYVAIVIAHAMSAPEHSGRGLDLDNLLRVRRSAARQPAAERASEVCS